MAAIWRLIGKGSPCGLQAGSRKEDDNQFDELRLNVRSEIIPVASQSPSETRFSTAYFSNLTRQVLPLIFRFAAACMPYAPTARRLPHIRVPDER